MGAWELVIWSMALGSIATVAGARLSGFVARPGPGPLRGVAFHLAFFAFVLAMSGVLRQVTQPDPSLLQALQVIAGPVFVGLANFWIRDWLGAGQRDWLMASGLRAASLVLPLAAAATFALPRVQQLPVAAGLALLGSSAMLWFAIRAWLMGDRLAPQMAFGCAMLLPAVAGLYALAMVTTLGSAAHFVLGVCAAAGNAFTGFALWRRDRHEWKAQRTDHNVLPFDPVTKLASGAELVRRLVRAQHRRRRTRRDGAVLAILVFDVERITAQVGTAGLNELYFTMARRIQKQVGVVNRVGRYWDRCFVCVAEAIHSPAWLRTLGLRVSTSLRRPIEVSGLHGERVRIRADIGVGVVHLPPGDTEVDDILHDAQRLAEAARAMPSRAAILDPASGEVVPVEQANLGRRPRHAGHLPQSGHPVRWPQRARS